MRTLKGTIELLETNGMEFYIYLPESYHDSTHLNYPVHYHLHGAMPFGERMTKTMLKADVVAQAKILEDQIDEQLSTQSIIVSPYDGVGMSMWSDAWQGNIQPEQDFISSLIPHIQSNFRVSTNRMDNTIQGFSMGGFGALKLGFKYPHLFGKIISWDGAIHTWATLKENRENIATEMFDTFENFMTNCPVYQGNKYLEVRDQFPMEVLIFEGALKQYNRDFRDRLTRLGIQFEYFRTACPHDFKSLLNATPKNLIFQTIR